MAVANCNEIKPLSACPVLHRARNYTVTDRGLPARSRPGSFGRLAPAFGATDTIAERGGEGAARIRDMTGGYGAHSVIGAVGTQESMMQAIRSARPGGYVGHVGVAHGVELADEEAFYAEVRLLGGPAPVRRFLPGLIAVIKDGEIDPGQVFDLTCPRPGIRGLPGHGRTLLSP